MQLVGVRPASALPKSPHEYKELYPERFASAFPKDLPVAPQGDDASWAMAASAVPCRVTRTGCSQGAPASSRKQDLAMNAIAMAVQQQMYRKGSCDEIPLTYFDRDRRQPMLALQAPVRTTAPVMLALPAPYAGDDSQSRGSQMSHPLGDGSQSPESKAVPEVVVGESQEKSAVDNMVELMKQQLGKSVGGVPLDQVHDAGQVAETGGVGNRAVRKRPSASVGGDVVRKRPAVARGSGDVYVGKLGCSKCRMSPVGCLQCKKASFTGRRAV